MATKVRAIKKGYFGLQLREVGDVFTIQDDGDFSEKWMERMGKESGAAIAQAQTGKAHGKKASGPAPAKSQPEKRVSDESKI